MHALRSVAFNCVGRHTDRDKNRAGMLNHAFRPPIRGNLGIIGLLGRFSGGNDRRVSVRARS